MRWSRSASGRIAISSARATTSCVELPITIDEAVLGAKVEVPTVGGRVQLTIPKGTSSGQVLRLKGKGVKNSTTGAAGDELVTVRIVLPDVDRRQPVVLPDRMAPEAPLRSRPARLGVPARSAAHFSCGLERGLGLDGDDLAP